MEPTQPLIRLFTGHFLGSIFLFFKMRNNTTLLRNHTIVEIVKLRQDNNYIINLILGRFCSS